MKIIENKVLGIKKEVYTQTCYWCGSILQLDASDIKRGIMVYSQREIDNNVKGFDCPCCNQFSPIK